MRTQVLAMWIWTIVFSTGALLQAPAVAAEAEYVGNAKCKMCHNKKAEGEQWNKWSQAKHASAFKNLASDKALEYAKAKGLQSPPQKTPECLRCHVTAYDAEKKAFHPEIAKEDGVQCESCHGPGSEHLVYGKKMMLKKDALDPTVPTLIVKPDETACLKCHNDQSPAWNPEKYTLEDGTKTGFDFKQAFETVAHLNPLKPREATEAKAGGEKK